MEDGGACRSELFGVPVVHLEEAKNSSIEEYEFELPKELQRPVKISYEGDVEIEHRRDGLYTAIIKRSATEEDIKALTFKSNCFLAALIGALRCHGHFYYGVMGRGSMPHFAWTDRNGALTHFVISPTHKKEVRRLYHYFWFDGVISNMSHSEFRLWNMKKLF